MMASQSPWFSNEVSRQSQNELPRTLLNGLVIAQTPARLEFVYTFVALDPDGHRLRAYKLAS
jgi:hypothetical protein